ncbi:hypothetical protein G9A89_000807 [Geosiphon pyriformis]|nr:hypothetical protein G9A89_000807 [Geosiphon pyriformis]
MDSTHTLCKPPPTKTLNTINISNPSTKKLQSHNQKRNITYEEILRRANRRSYELEKLRNQRNLEKDEKIKRIKLRFEETLLEIGEARELGNYIEKQHKKLTRQHEFLYDLEEQRYLVSIGQFFIDYPNMIRQAIDTWKAGLEECEKIEWKLKPLQSAVSDLLKKVKEECRELWGPNQFQEFERERERQLNEEELARQKKEGLAAFF